MKLTIVNPTVLATIVKEAAKIAVAQSIAKKQGPKQVGKNQHLKQRPALKARVAGAKKSQKGPGAGRASGEGGGLKSGKGNRATFKAGRGGKIKVGGGSIKAGRVKNPSRSSMKKK